MSARKLNLMLRGAFFLIIAAALYVGLSRSLTHASQPR
jgi:hypothetical protein